MSGFFVLAYAFLAVFVGLITWDVAGDARAPAIGFLCGLAWPITLLAAIAWGLFLVSRAIVRSFGALLGR